MSITVLVFHGKLDRSSDDFDRFVDHQPVGLVTVDVAGYSDPLEMALELAYQATQNIDGSWSRRYSQALPSNVIVVDCLQPLIKTDDGRELGLRSTTVGDRFLVCDDAFLPQMYQVDAIGFKKV